MRRSADSARSWRTGAWRSSTKSRRKVARATRRRRRCSPSRVCWRGASERRLSTSAFLTHTHVIVASRSSDLAPHRALRLLLLDGTDAAEVSTSVDAADVDDDGDDGDSDRPPSVGSGALLRSSRGADALALAPTRQRAAVRALLGSFAAAFELMSLSSTLSGQVPRSVASAARAAAAAAVLCRRRRDRSAARRCGGVGAPSPRSRLRCAALGSGWFRRFSVASL